MALKIKTIKDYIVELEGQNELIINEIIKFKNDARGIVMKANEKGAFVALLDSSIDKPLTIGDTVTSTGEEYSIDIKESFMGNIISVDGTIFTDYDSSHLVNSKETPKKPIFRIARPIYSRDFVNSPLVTGIAAIDWAIPVGKGQRELILGDRKTGKTALAFNAIIAQQKTDVICIYVAIGQKKTSTLDLHAKLEKFGMQDRTIIVAASADQTATKKWLAPFVGVTIAEYYQEKYGKDVLIIYDDLSKHADAYRELSLLLQSAPAREAYPGDIFYLHSKLLERAGKFNVDFGGGSITALPVIQTEAGDITSYIPTNVISITDGQIFTSKSLFNQGQRPAIDIPYSVSRVGSAAQIKTLSKVAGGLKMLVSQYEEAKKMVRLSGQVSEENKTIIDRGRVFTSLLVQPENDVIDNETGTLILTLFRKDYLNFFKNVEEIIFIKKLLGSFLEQDYLGQKIKAAFAKVDMDKVMIEMMIREIILPFIKHHLVSKYPHLRKDQDFIKVYGQVRDDGRVYNAFKKNIEGVN